MKNFTVILLALLMMSATLFTARATNVSGGIYANTTWTFANSPYIVTDTVVVFPGVTLTIEAGVTVKFADTTYLEVRGQIIAIGTITDSITFTSNNSSPTSGIYEGLRNNWNNTDTAKFLYCNCRYSINGLKGYNCIIKHCTMEYNQYGGSAYLVDSSVFKNNNYGLDLYNINGSYANHCIFLNNGTGIFCDGTNVKNCTLRNNQCGIYLQNSNDDRTFVDSCIINNNQSGILVTNPAGGGSSLIQNCDIDSNTNFGVIIGTDDYEVDSFINCQIKFNDIGISDTILYNGGGQKMFTLCQIENNNIGFNLLNNQYYSIYCNKICNTNYNIIYGLNYSTGNLTAIGNTWCDTDSINIESKIYDGYDNIALGLVNVFPIDTTNCYQTGCNILIHPHVSNASCGTCATGNASVNVTGGFPPYSYTWSTSPVQTNATATGLLPGTYTVCVNDIHGCHVCDNSIVVDTIVCTNFTDSTIVSNTSCDTCATGSAYIYVSGGMYPYYYTWYTSPLQNGSGIYGLRAGTYHYCVVDNAGCVICDSITVGVNCSAYFLMYPDTTVLHTYICMNEAIGVAPISNNWSWGDGNHDYTAYPSHTYSYPGNYTICLTITDADSCTNTFCNSFYLQRTSNTMVTVNVIGNTTGINTISTINNHCSIYPNPNDGNFVMEYHLSLSDAELRITDIAGRELNSYTITSKDGTQNINATSLSKGIYFWEIISEGSVLDKGKMIKE